MKFKEAADNKYRHEGEILFMTKDEVFKYVGSLFMKGYSGKRLVTPDSVRMFQFLIKNMPSPE